MSPGPASAAVPAGLGVPVEVALARAVDSLPGAAGMSGGSSYLLMKFDGFRLVVTHGAAGVRLWSRRGTELTRTFSEVAAAARHQFPLGSVVDGEVFCWTALVSTLTYWPNGSAPAAPDLLSSAASGQRRSSRSTYGRPRCRPAAPTMAHPPEDPHRSGPMAADAAAVPEHQPTRTKRKPGWASTRPPASKVWLSRAWPVCTEAGPGMNGPKSASETLKR